MACLQHSMTMLALFYLDTSLCTIFGDTCMGDNIAFLSGTLYDQSLLPALCLNARPK